MRRVSKAVLAGLVAWLFPIVANAKVSPVPGFAAAVIAAILAEDNCSGMQPDLRKQAAMWAAMEKAGARGEALRAELARQRPIVEEALRKNGAAEWCSAVWSLFGPDGIGSIQRK